jgi:hypothetical protein
MNYQIVLIPKTYQMQPLQIQRSGNKVTVKVPATISSRINSIRPSAQRQPPPRGINNPPHFHVKVPK